MSNEIKRIHNSGVGVLDKFVAILSFLVETGPSELSEVVKQTGISRSTAHRLLSALEVHHLVVRSSDGYVLGSRLAGWGEVAGSKALVEIARPTLIKLRDQTGESTQLYVKEGKQRICVASVEPPIGLKNTVPVGAIMPLEVGSAGKVFLIWGSNGSNSEKDVAIRKQGWVKSVAEREAGVASVSSPVMGTGGVLKAAVSVSGPISRLEEYPPKQLEESVVAAAKEIEEALKHQLHF